MYLDAILEDILKKPIAIYCPLTEQKRIIIDLFEECNNPYRVDDEGFKYAHFSKDIVTFFEDSYGTSNHQREVISFKEFSKGFLA